MRTKNILCTILTLALMTGSAVALNPDDELWITAAARGAGKSGSFWMTDLVVMNLGEETAIVEITWFERFADNSEAEALIFEIGGSETLVLEDIIGETFGLQEAAGAIHIELEEDEGDKAGDEDEVMLVANARIYSIDEDGETVGQGFEGIISNAAIDSENDETTHVIGISDNDDYRANWYGLNITTDEETDEPEEAEFMVEVLGTDGQILTSESFTMAPFEPMLSPVADLGAGSLESATLRFTMIEGQGIFGASKVDDSSNDPTTLEAHWECEADEEGEDEFTDEFFIEDCTFVTTGRNPFWILEPGFELVLEGEEDGVEIAATITVLDETFMVDGIETRVVEEVETEDGELVEISRNYFAYCTETGSVFYFGEHVDDYEDGVVVGHEGEWLAGEDDAEAGIIMPGTILVGARYMQEVAPGVALDRAEHISLGNTVETEAGIFEDCLMVEDTTGFEPDAEGDVKYYCHGVGNVVDEELELVEWTDPAMP